MDTAVWRGRSWVVSVLAGVLCALVGVLPWLVHGARLALQNLWAAPTVAPSEMPLVALPFSQYQLDLVAGVIVIASALAAGAARFLVARGVKVARPAVVLGLLLAQVAALVQTAGAVASGLGFSATVASPVDDSQIYLVIMIGWIVVAILVGAGVYLLLTAKAHSAVVIGVAIAAVVLDAWIRGFADPLGAIPQSSGGLVLFVATWAPAAVVGVAIGWTGIRSVFGAVAALAALGVLWVGTAAITALVAAAGSRALLRLPAELAHVAGMTFAAELLGPALAVALAGAAIAVLGLAIRSARGLVGHHDPGSAEASQQ